MCSPNPAWHRGAGMFSPSSVGDFVFWTVKVHSKYKVGNGTNYTTVLVITKTQ
jgi:hypothetical protein